MSCSAATAAATAPIARARGTPSTRREIRRHAKHVVPRAASSLARASSREAVSRRVVTARAAPSSADASDAGDLDRAAKDSNVASTDAIVSDDDALPGFVRERAARRPRVADVLKNPAKFARDVGGSIPTGASRAIDEIVTNVVMPVNRLEPLTREYSAERMREKTDELRLKLRNGATEDDIIVEAFAVVREAARRELNMRHFDVQLVGGCLLHQGRIAEMATGEGKTLTATLPAYLNALSGKGVHVVTVNDYLARRDAEWMGRVHRALGLTVGVVQSDMDPAERQAAYACDVTYVTNQEVGFDYLRDNMATDASELVMARPFNFAIVDEVDSVLIDEGRNPLLITGPGDEGDEEMTKYTIASEVAAQLRENLDYTVDLKQKTADLTERGMMVAEQLLGVTDVWDTYDPWGRYLLLAVKAKALYLRDVHYIVRDGQVMIVDESTGRVQANRRWNDNIHQAVEAKEGVEIKRENTTVASVSYQCLFKLYRKLSGMTGTASTESEELFTTYGLQVVPVPTHRPNLRKDKPHAMFRTAEARWNAVADLVTSCHWEGRPVLVGTTSVEHSELLSRLLSEYRWRAQDGTLVTGVPHKLLNARPQLAAREAEIVSQAGRANAVTIATNMAGRGTDIVLGGNAAGLCRSYLERLLFPQLSPGSEEARDALAPDPMSSVCTSSKTEASARAAAGLARVVAEADQALPVAPEAVVDLVASAVEHAEALARGGAVKAAAELAARREEEKQGGPNPVVNALRQAAIDLLADCETQCLNEAALVREIGGLQVVGTALHDSRRVDNQLRGRAGRQGDPGSTIFCLSMEDDLMRVYCPGWASSSVWDWSGMDDDTPLYSKVVDDQLATIQTQIEDFHATHRASTFDTDRIIDGQREAIYAVRRKVLEEGQAPLRERLVRYVEWIVDDACDRAGVDGRSEISDWRIDDMLEDLRSVFSSRRDQWLRESGRATGSNPHFLPGVDAEHIKDALLKKGDMPTGLPLPSLDAPAELVAAAIAGVDVRDMRGGESDKNAKQVADTEPEASESAVFARVERRLFDEKKRGSASMGEEAKRNRGVNAGESRLLRAYLSETAIALYLDRFARLSRHYDRADLEAVERVWVLRAIDERWQRHIVEMQVLRNSVNVRAFGQLDPMEEYRIDGARAFVDMVRDVRRKTLANVFFFVGSAVEPTLDFELEERQALEAAEAEALAKAEATKKTSVPGRVAISEVLAEEAARETVDAPSAARFRETASRASSAARAMALEAQEALIEEEKGPSAEEENDERGGR